MLTNTPAGLDEIIDTFGSLRTPDFESRYIVPFTLPYPLFYDHIKITRARCHHLLVDNFQAVFKHLLDGGLSDQVSNFSGIYNSRSIIGQPMHASTHSWGIAIDLEASRYPLGSSARFPKEVVDVFRSAGFFYGGDFLSRKDPMHFQFATHY